MTYTCKCINESDHGNLKKNKKVSFLRKKLMVLNNSISRFSTKPIFKQNNSRNLNFTSWPLTGHPVMHVAVVAVVAASAFGMFNEAALALEPNSITKSKKAPGVQNQEKIILPQIIIKYSNGKSAFSTKGNGEKKAAEIDTYLKLQQFGVNQKAIDGLDLKFIGEMSGNAGVFEVEGLQGLQAAESQRAIQVVADQISKLPDVEYAEPNQFAFIQQVDDPRFGEQWHLRDTKTGVNIIPAWKKGKGENVPVAVIDTGYLPHIDLVDNILPGYDFVSPIQVANDGDGRDTDASDPGDWVSASDFWCPSRERDSSWHGTHVAGTIAATTENNLGVASLAYKAKIVPVRVLGKCGGTSRDIADGIRWAAGLPVPSVPQNQNPAKVLNLSLGGPSQTCPAVYQDAINDVVSAGATVVVAAGNSNQDAAAFAPANCKNVITVASTNRAGGRAFYTNRGSVVEIAAPGGETFANKADGVLSTINSGKTVPAADSYAFYQGTSMAAPHVAGVVAMLYALDKNITPKEVLDKLQTTAKPFPVGVARPCSTLGCGAGIVDAAAAANSVKVKSAKATLPQPAVIPDGWIGVDNQGNSYAEPSMDGVAELWFEANEGTGETIELVESEAEYNRLRSLPVITPWKGKIGPLKIIGNDDRIQVKNTSRYPASAQVLVVLPNGRCSGALIGRDLVLTAGHCVHSGGSGGSWQTAATVYPGKNGPNSPFGFCSATRLYSVNGWTNNKNPAYDFGAIKLNCDVGERAGWMGYFWQAASLVGKSALISSYPGDKPLEQWSHGDKVRSNSNLQTRYQTDTVGGNSGSGVFATSGVPQGCGGPCVHTAHAYGGTTFNSGTRITQPLFNNLVRWSNAPK